MPVRIVHKSLFKKNKKQIQTSFPLEIKELAVSYLCNLLFLLQALFNKLAWRGFV